MNAKQEHALFFITMIFMAVLVMIEHHVLAVEDSVKRESIKLHLVDNESHVRVDLSSGQENRQPANTSFKEALSLSFPPFVVGNEALINETPSNSVVSINFLTGEKKVLHKFPDDFMTGVVGGIDELFVWVSTNKRAFDGKNQIWKINKRNGEATQVGVAGSSYFSAGCGKLAYVGTEHQILLKENIGVENEVAIHGDMPVILPDCSGMVFVNSSLLVKNLVIYSFTSDKKTLDSSLFFKEYSFPIRVSRDSKFVAFKYKNDLFDEPVHVLRILDGKEIYSTGQRPVKNWFFAD